MNATPTRDAAAWHLVGLVAPVVILSGNLTGGAWTLAGVVLVLLVYPVLDVVSGTGRPASVTHTSRPLLTALPYIHVVLQGWRVCHVNLACAPRTVTPGQPGPLH